MKNTLKKTAEYVQRHCVVRRGVQLSFVQPTLTLVVRGSKGGLDLSRSRVSLPTVVQLCYDDVRRLHDLARVYKISTRHVRRLQVLGAPLTLQIQNNRIRAVQQKVRQNKLQFLSRPWHGMKPGSS